MQSYIKYLDFNHLKSDQYLITIVRRPALYMHKFQSPYNRVSIQYKTTDLIDDIIEFQSPQNRVSMYRPMIYSKKAISS